MKKFSFILFILFAAAGAVYSNSQTTKNTLIYTLQPKMIWEEKDLDALGDIVTNYILSQNNDINMNFTHLDEDLSKTIKENSLDEVVAQINRGKDYIYSMMNVSKHTIIEKKLSFENNINVLIIKSQYQLKEKEFNLIEKYYILPDEVLIASFRWISKDEKEVYFKDAMNEFNNIKVKVIVK